MVTVVSLDLGTAQQASQTASRSVGLLIVQAGWAAAPSWWRRARARRAPQRRARRRARQRRRRSRLVLL